MDPITLVALALGAAAAGAGRRVAVQRRRRRDDGRAELDGVRHVAEEDVVVFGEQLRRLDEVVGDHDLDPDARTDYQTALDAYEKAQRAVDGLTDASQVSRVTEALTDGRYALACVRARVEGRPLPTVRTPCFFNPQHGPAATEVMWTTGARGSRQVPACAVDAARVANRERPEVRTVDDGSGQVPYWEAGSAYEPYRSGYYTADLTHVMRSLRHGP